MIFVLWIPISPSPAGSRRGAQTQGWHGAEAAGVAEDGHRRQRCLAKKSSRRPRWEVVKICEMLRNLVVK